MKSSLLTVKVYIPLILFSVSMNALAQICLKKGMILIGQFQFSVYDISAALMKVVVNPFIILGMICYVLSIGIWLVVLSRVEVSFAYPFLSVGYVLIAVLSYLFLGENLSFYRIIGITIICVGLFFLSKS